MAIVGVHMPRLNFFVAGAVLFKHPLKITKTYYNFEVKHLVDISFLKEISQKCFVFKLQSFIFKGSLAKKILFFNFEIQILKDIS